MISSRPVVAAALGALVGCVALAPLPAGAQSPAPTWAERPQLSGDWGGARDELAGWGVVPSASYTAGVWANLHGGFESGARYEGFAQWGLDLELERLVGWRGARFHVGWHSYHGGQPSDDLLGLFANDALFGNEAADAVRFYGIYLEQELFDGALRVKLGQIAVDDDLPDSPYLDAFLNASFTSLNSGRAELLAPFYPVAAPGLFVDARPTPDWQIGGGVYTAEPGADEKSNWGFDWKLDRGASFAARIRRHWSPWEHPGAVTAGVLATTSRIAAFDGTGSERGVYAFFGRVEQALWVDAEGNPRLGAFARGGYAPQGDRVVARAYAAGGLVWYAPFPGRRHDLVGVAFGYTDFGPDYLAAGRAAGQDLSGHESLVEVTLRVQVTGWLQVQPDLQIHLDPHFSRRDAVAVGLQAVVTL